MTDDLLCARCNHSESEHGDMGLCDVLRCKCTGFTDDLFDDDDDLDDGPQELDFDRDSAA